MKSAKNMQEMMLTKPVGSLVVKLAVPTIITMLITSFYSLADTFFVAQLGVVASSAVGIVFSIMAIIQATGLFFGQGAANTISPMLGRGEVDKASHVISTSVFTSIALLSVFSVVCLSFIHPIMKFLGATEETIDATVAYGRIIAIGAPWLGPCYTMNNIFRSEGKAMLGMYGMATGAILNIVLDALFIFGFGWGLKGAALATVLSQGVSFVIMVSLFIAKKSSLKLSIRNFTPSWENYRSIFSLGFPSLLRNIGATFCNISLMHVAALYVTAATAAMSIVGRIVHFFLSVCIGFGQGMQPVVGYNWGAGKKDRVASAYSFSLKVGVVVFLFLSLILGFGSRIIIKAFISDQTAIEIGSKTLLFQAFSLPFMVPVILEGMLIQCTGHGKESSLLAILRQGVIYIPVLFIANALLGLLGVELAQAVSDIICFVITWAITRYVRRKEGF